jgi:PiT family inorganic phosphate transporter
VSLEVVLFTLAVALGYVYAFVGGFTDAANAIATSVGTRVLSPRAAVIIAGTMNLLGGLTGTAVAVTIGSGIVDPADLTLVTVIAGVGGAMTWSLITYLFGIPVSETHGLIGGLIGAGVATAGTDVIEWGTLTEVVAAIGLSPLLGFFGAGALLVAIYWAFHRVRRGRVMPTFVHLQRLSAAFMSFSHGRNDAQKPMGVVALALALYFGRDEVTIPVWLIFTAAATAALGMATGGWRIVHTLGERVTKLDPVQGFAAETAGAGVIQLASSLGIPISTTHAITTSILGVGATRRVTAVRWGLTGHIFLSWLVTVPMTALLGALYVVLLRPLA